MITHSESGNRWAFASVCVFHFSPKKQKSQEQINQTPHSFDPLHIIQNPSIHHRAKVFPPVVNPTAFHQTSKLQKTKQPQHSTPGQPHCPPTNAPTSHPNLSKICPRSAKTSRLSRLSVWMASWTDLAFTGAVRLLSWLDLRVRERGVLAIFLALGVEVARLTRAGARA